jgi:DNA-binding NarL/FixJ family response regulator
VTNVFILDDHSVIRDGLREILHRAGFNVVGEASNCDSIDAELLKLKVDVLILDIQLEGTSGLQFLDYCREKISAIGVVLFTMSSQSYQIAKAFKLGALAYISKSSSMVELIFAVTEAAQGRKYVGNSLLKQMADPSFDKISRNPAELLSARELEVLGWVVRGKTSAYIAAKLNLSPATVETYRSRLMLKLGIDNVPALVRYAIQWDMVDVNEDLGSTVR